MVTFPELIDDNETPNSRPSYPWLLLLLTLFLAFREVLAIMPQQFKVLDYTLLYALRNNPYLWAVVALILGIIVGHWRDGVANCYRLSILLSFGLWYLFLDEFRRQQILFENFSTFERYRAAAIFFLNSGTLLLCLRAWWLRPKASPLWALWEYWGRLLVFISLWGLVATLSQKEVLRFSLVDINGVAFLHQLSRGVFCFGSLVLLIVQQLYYTKTQRYKAWGGWLLLHLLLLWVWPDPLGGFPFYFAGGGLFTSLLGLCYTALGPDSTPVHEG